MKIVWVASALTDTRGGALTVTRNLVQGLGENQQTYIGSCNYMGDMFEQNGGRYIKSFHGFEPVTIRNWLLIPVSFVLGLWQVIKHRKVYESADKVVVATAHTEVFFTIPWIIWWLKKPVIVMNHTGRCPKSLYKSPMKWLMSWVYDRSKVVFVSQSHLDMWLEHDLVGRQPEVIYNGTQVSDFTPNIKNHNPLVFGYLGRIEEEKGLDTLFESLENMVGPMKLKVGGEGKDDQKYKAWTAKIANKNPKIHIEWPGQVSDTKKFFDSIDCLIFPSKFESFGLVMVEAWERGVPVISSDILAFVELKSKSNELERNLVFAADSALGLSSKMLEFIQNNSTYTSQQQQNELHDIVTKEFSLDKQIQSFKSLL